MDTARITVEVCDRLLRLLASINVGAIKPLLCNQVAEKFGSQQIARPWSKYSEGLP